MICLISPMVNILVYMNLELILSTEVALLIWSRDENMDTIVWKQHGNSVAINEGGGATCHVTWRMKTWIQIIASILVSCLSLSYISCTTKYVISLLILFSNEHKVTTFFCSSFFSPSWTDQNLVSSWISWIPSINNCRAGLRFCLNKLSEVTEILGQGKRRKIKCSTVCHVKKKLKIFLESILH